MLRQSPVISDRIYERFKVLLAEVDMCIEQGSTIGSLEANFVSATYLIDTVFGEDSHYSRSLTQWRDDQHTHVDVKAEFLRTTLSHAINDLDAGLTSALDLKITGDVMDDLLQLARQTLRDGQKNVAAVLIAAALEDSLKRCARLHGLDIEGKFLPEVIRALNSSGVRVGGQKGAIKMLPDFRNAALHANWSEVEETDVASVIAFVEQFLMRNF